MLTPEEQRAKKLSDNLNSLYQELRTLNSLLAQRIQQEIDAATKQAASANQTQNTAQPITVITESSSAEKSERQSEGKKAHRFQKWNISIQVLLLMATVGAVFAAVWYASIADKQMWVMQGQWMMMDAQWLTMQDTLAEIRKQTPDLTRSAMAAKSAADTAAKALGASDRPWLSAESVEPIGELVIRSDTIELPVSVNPSSSPNRQN